LDCDRTATQWRLFSHEEEVRSKTALVDIYSTVPEHYSELRRLYQFFLSLPVTTASVERTFSKLLMVKSKLRTTMNHERLEALVFAAVEKDIASSSSDDDLVSEFAALANRRLPLGDRRL